MLRLVAPCLALALAPACTVPRAQPASDGLAPPSAVPPPPVGPGGDGRPTEPLAAPTHAPVLVRLLVLDTNERAPTPLPDVDGSFLRGAMATLDGLARCRESTGSRAHWVEMEWRVDDTGRVLDTVTHPLFTFPAGRPPALAPETLRCIDESATNPPFAARSGRSTARVFALVGFELPDLGGGASEPGLAFDPDPDGHCTRPEDCPPTKHCEPPPRVPCPRAGAANESLPFPK